MTRYRHIYERIFTECVSFKYKDELVVVVHNDSAEAMTECLQKLEKQLTQHNAVCGLSFPSKVFFRWVSSTSMPKLLCITETAASGSDLERSDYHAARQPDRR